VSFKNCYLLGVSANGSLSEGKFVGFLSGYDNGETLSFDAECSTDENTAVTDYISYYKSENQSVWLDAVNTKYDGWLGTETYRRGIVMFEGKRLVPKWDGKTAVEPLLYNETNNQFEIYSPFDLAGVRKETPSPAAIYFKANIDMNGIGNDGRRATPLPMRDKSEVNDDNLFDAFNSVKTLDGGGFTLYNLSIEETHDGYSGAAFIKGASGDTEHKNLTIQNADIKNYHDPNFPVMNDYKSLVVALNDYGKNHLGFDLKVTHSMINCLNLCTPGATYNIMQIIREQLILEEYNENSIKFINKEVYEKLRIAILKNNEFFNI